MFLCCLALSKKEMSCVDSAATRTSKRFFNNEEFMCSGVDHTCGEVFATQSCIIWNYVRGIESLKI